MQYRRLFSKYSVPPSSVECHSAEESKVQKHRSQHYAIDTRTVRIKSSKCAALTRSEVTGKCNISNVQINDIWSVMGSLQ